MAGKLTLPRALVVSVLGAGTAAVLASMGTGACGGGTSADAQCHFFCITDTQRDAPAPGAPDADPCGQVVCDPNTCPPGCEPVG